MAKRPRLDQNRTGAKCLPDQEQVKIVQIVVNTIMTYLFIYMLAGLKV